MLRPVINPGYRWFRCSNCGEQWRTTAVNHETTRPEICGNCGEGMFARISHPDTRIPVSDSGRLMIKSPPIVLSPGSPRKRLIS